jgi:hypothetical protein
MSNGLDETRAVAFARQVLEINKKDLGIRIFSGLECDILRDGELDLANDAARGGPAKSSDRYGRSVAPGAHVTGCGSR